MRRLRPVASVILFEADSEISSSLFIAMARQASKAAFKMAA
ncbi:MAG: hypothetical protein ABR861_12280 [Terriglobales bacterium]